MKKRVFFASKELLIDYLHRYGTDRTIDHEVNIALYAKEWWEKKMNQEFMIVFEQNNKMHNYPDRFTPTVEELKDILDTYLEVDTPVDFALAPIEKMRDYDRYAYPFQVKQLRIPVTDDTSQKLADFISEKANRYKDTRICFIVDPQLIGNSNGKMFRMGDLQDKLTIRDDAMRAVYMFQRSGDDFTFLTIWKSPLVTE
jgi:hypothetical protein